MLDIYSRKIVGWMLAERESGCLAKELIATCCERENITADSSTNHSDRGAAMMSKPVVALLDALDIIKSVSSPHVSNDSPFSEVFLKKAKYQPNFPDRFGSLPDGCVVLRPLFDWYNYEHRHSGIGYMTFASVHDGTHVQIRKARNDVLQKAYARHPGRFVRGAPRAVPLPIAAWINPPKPKDSHVSPVQNEEVETKTR